MVRVTLRTLVSALASDELRAALAWLDGGTRPAVDDLLDRRDFELSIYHGQTRVTWTVRPVAFLPFAHRLGRELPTCVDRFTGARAPRRNGSA
ncbi:hypothetical protein K7472_27300 [Streptomyces sp. PTM05]|uniref:DUF2470 domain-containing protein n=1 Tax=Streptantibioticus parmotrematis TaxID=2873249 RepID=A0ABS7QZ86_9ACTN|nr:hypothetical protein [Streptantibioticus parmotrematis]MBY8888520.1 hypothetical protein [Streptantibioticus parmotrematis]